MEYLHVYTQYFNPKYWLIDQEAKRDSFKLSIWRGQICYSSKLQQYFQ